MGVAVTAAGVTLASTMVRLNQSLERMKEIAARSKSTDATLVRIARMQASWAPGEQVVQEGMEGRGASFAWQMEATAQALACIPVAHHDMKPEKTTTTNDAHKVFDAWSTQQEVTMSNIIHVSVSHIIYPVTEDVLRQVFQMYGYGVTKMAMFQGSSWVEASVQLRSGHEAVHARDVLHGRNIYDGCCNMSIKCTPATASSTAAALSLAMGPKVTPTISNTVATSTLFTTAMGTPDATLANLSTGSASMCAKKLFVEMPSPPMPRSDVEFFQPTTVPTSAESQVQSTAMSLVTETTTTSPVIVVATVASPLCHEKGQQHHVLEETRNQRNPRRVIKWLPRVRVTRLSVRWTLKRKYRHSSRSSPPPRPSDQPCSGEVPTPKSLLWPPFCRFVTSLGCNSELMPPEKKAWCKNAFSPGNKELQMVHLFNYANCQTVSNEMHLVCGLMLLLEYCLGIVLRPGYDMMFVNLLEEWKLSTTMVEMSGADKFRRPEKYNGLDCKWTLKLSTHICCDSRSSSMHAAWLKLWAPNQCSICVVWPLIYFSTARQGFMIKEEVNLSATSRKHCLQQLSCYSVLSCVGDSDSTTVNYTQCFAAYLECSLDLGDHEMCRFLSISDATILCQKFLQLHTSVASLLSKTRKLENTRSTVRQWDPGTVKLIAMGVLSWIGNAWLRLSSWLKIRYGCWTIRGKFLLVGNAWLRLSSPSATWSELELN